MQSPLKEIIQPLWEPVSDEPGWKWVQDNVELPADSELKNFDFELFPLARFVLDQLCHNENLRNFTEMLSAQVGKTVTILAYVCWKIINRPSSVGWYTDTNVNAKGDYKTKILPALENCGKVLPMLPNDRAKKNNTLIQFGFMNLRVMGAETKTNREGKTMTEVLCDEARNYPPGAMEQIDNRFKTITNFRRIVFSSAGTVLDEPWKSFVKGSRHLGFWNCPSCNHKQTLRFGRDSSPLYPEPRSCGGFMWDDNDKTHPGENLWNFAEVEKTVRYQCENPECKREFKENEKLSIIRNVVFQQTNPMAQAKDVSTHCWEAYMPFSGCSWSSIVTRFLNAVVAMRQGNIEPMKVFHQEVLGEPWEEKGEKPLEGEILNRRGEYSIGEEWPPEKKCAKLLDADVQQGYLKYGYALCSPLNEIRVVDTGRLLDLDELRAYQLAKKVKDGNVGVDCAWNDSINSYVMSHCAKYGSWIQARSNMQFPPARVVKKDGYPFFWSGWVALLGDEAKEFTVNLNGANVKTHIKQTAYDANAGKGLPKYILRVSWCNDHYKEELYLRRVKGIGPLFEIPKNIGDEFIKQLTVTELHNITNAEGQIIGQEWREKGRHDDADCLQMIFVLRDVNALV